MVDLVALKAANEKRWAVAKMTRSFSGVAARLAAEKRRYEAVGAKTGVPWFITAVIHEREASQNFNTQLGQGDPLNQVSHHVPAGRGPFATWEEGAIDALVNCQPHAAANTDWSAGGSLTLLERYNGTGYATRGLPSPYVWSGTDQYIKGKFIRDGVFDPEVIDAQLGCAGLLKSMMAIDPTITFTGARITPPPPVKPVPGPQPATASSWVDLILNLVRAIFGRK